MKKLTAILLLMAFVCAFSNPAAGQKNLEFKIPKDYRPVKIAPSAKLQAILEKSVRETVAQFAAKGVRDEHLSATVLDLSSPETLQTASVRGEEKIYPASVSKMFYMVALERWLEDGRVKMTPELERGLRDMIVDSSNEATQYVLDVLTGTSSGAELPAKEFAKWAYKRNVVNRYFTAMNYQNINVNQKTFCEDAYGIEQQFRNYKGENRNKLTTNATARLLAEIVLGKTNTPARTKLMMDLMKRDPFAKSGDFNDQAHGFTGIALINKNLRDAKLWSKAGWTSQTRHDAAYIETADGLRFVIVVFTEKHAQERNLIPTVAEKVLDGLGKTE